jgi:hypothetical protein
MMWPPLLLAVALGLGHAHQLGAASLRPGLPVGSRRSAFACALRSHMPRSTRIRPDGFGACRSARATMCAQPADTALRCLTANPLHPVPAEGLWCAPTFRLNDHPTPHVLEHGTASALGAVRIGSLLSRREAARMVEMADSMGFVQPSGDEGGDRRVGALSWALHDELCDTLSRRVAPHVPRAICAHRGKATAERREELLRMESARRMLSGGRGEGAHPWVRRCDGAPEGTYQLAGLNARCRIYRYEH